MQAISWIILVIFELDTADVQFVEIEIALAYAEIAYIDVHLFVVWNC